MSARAPPKPDPPKTKEGDPLLEKIYEGEAPDTTDTNLRWAAYANRIRTIMNAGHRYIAYTSDIGESFRPVAYPNLVRTAYGISWLYLAGDVAHESYKAYVSNQAVLHGGHSIASVPEWLRPAAKSDSSAKTTSRAETYNPAAVVGRTATGENAKSKDTTKPVFIGLPPEGAKSTATQSPNYPRKVSPLSAEWDLDEYGNKDNVKLMPSGSVPFLEDWRTVMVQRAIFQSLASMGLPAFTIHSIVKYSGRGMRNVKNTAIRTWGPIGLGLAVVPALPYIFDEPVEKAVDWVFEKGYETLTGKKGISEKRAYARAHGEDGL